MEQPGTVNKKIQKTFYSHTTTEISKTFLYFHHETKISKTFYSRSKTEISKSFLQFMDQPGLLA